MQNKAQGHVFEVETVKRFKEAASNDEKQMIFVTKDGTAVRVDAMGYDKYSNKKYKYANRLIVAETTKGICLESYGRWRKHVAGSEVCS